MKPTEGAWDKRAWELIARHEILLLKRANGLYDTQEWNALIEDLQAHNMWALANDTKREMAQHEKPME